MLILPFSLYAEEQPLAELKIHSQAIQQKKDHQVIFNKWFPSATDGGKIQSQQGEQRANTAPAMAPSQPVIFFTVSATIYDNQTTHLELFSHATGKRDSFEAYSNTNWNFIDGFHRFEAKGKSFIFLGFNQNRSIHKIRDQREQGSNIEIPIIPEDLPSYKENGACYALVKGNPNDEEAIEFLEAVHDFYDDQFDELLKAFNQQKADNAIRQQKLEELKNNPPAKQDVIINYWKAERTPDSK